jgi:hypothetical protein
MTLGIGMDLVVSAGVVLDIQPECVMERKENSWEMLQKCIQYEVRRSANHELFARTVQEVCGFNPTKAKAGRRSMGRRGPNSSSSLWQCAPPGASFHPLAGPPQR